MENHYNLTIGGRMKQLICLFIIITVSFPGALRTEEIPMIENPAVPAAKNAGRTVTLKEVLRITDEQGDFYFKYPARIKIAPDESIFLVDKDQFLRFDKTGRFLNNQYKKGEGPGEYSSIDSYHFAGGSIILVSSQPAKILKTDLTGKLLEESKFPSPRGAWRILGFDCGKYWSLTSDIDALLKRNNGIADFVREVTWTTPGGEVHKTGVVFTEKWSVNKLSSEGRVAIAINFLYDPQYVLDGNKSLFTATTQAYSIYRFNLETSKITAKFRRKYSSVPFQPEKPKEGENRSSRPETEFFADVYRILVHSDHLWVLTSTVVKGKGVLVDVFTKEGKYTDNFYLPLPGVETPHDLLGKPFTLYKNFLFTVESGEDENPEVVKYLLNWE